MQLIIDRHAAPTVETRALGVQARTLEIYDHLGIADRAIELGQRAVGANFWTAGRRAAHIPLGDIGQGLSPYPYILVLGQDDNELLLGESLRKNGNDVHWNTELQSLEQNADHVKAAVKQADGSMREIRTKWVCGCDGARSAVRSLNGIDFPGAPYEHVFFVADTTATGPLYPSELNVYLWRDGFHLFFPMRGENHWRVVGILPTELRSRDSITFSDVTPSIHNEAGIEVKFQECRWFSTYRIHHRRAEKFQDRRCFLLGDAAHIHSPVGAQGMNTGLQDAYNLGWKLALVAAGRANEALLDSYQEERLPVAENLLSTTDNAFSLIVSDRWISRMMRTRLIAKIAALAMRFDRIRKLAFYTISQIGIHYRPSSLSETVGDLQAEAPRAGDRFPFLQLRMSPPAAAENFFRRLDDTCFNLVLIGTSSNELKLQEFGNLLAVHEVPINAENEKELGRAHISVPSFYLLRPDCYIGLAGARFDAAIVSRYLTGRLGISNER